MGSVRMGRLEARKQIGVGPAATDDEHIPPPLGCVVKYRLDLAKTRNAFPL